MLDRDFEIWDDFLTAFHLHPPHSVINLEGSCQLVNNKFFDMSDGVVPVLDSFLPAQTVKLTLDLSSTGVFDLGDPENLNFSSRSGLTRVWLRIAQFHDILSDDFDFFASHYPKSLRLLIMDVDDVFRQEDVFVDQQPFHPVVWLYDPDDFEELSREGTDVLKLVGLNRSGQDQDIWKQAEERVLLNRLHGGGWMW